MNETNKQTTIETEQLTKHGNTKGYADNTEDAELQSDDLSQIVNNEVTDDTSSVFSFPSYPSIAKRISTRLGLYSAFLVLIPLLMASTLAFLNQGASKQTQETVVAQLSENADRVAESIQWQLASKLDTASNASLAGGTLLQKINRELDYQFFDTLYEVAAPLNNNIRTSSDPRLTDVVKEIAAPIEANGGLLYLFDSSLRRVYASPISSDNEGIAELDLASAGMLKDFSGQQLVNFTGETALLTRRSLPAADWQMVMYQPAPAAAMSTTALMRPLAWLTVLGPLLALLLGNLWGFFNFQRPLNELRDAVQRLLSGKLTASVPRNRKDELGLLTKEVSLLSQKYSAVVAEEAGPKERLFEAQERIRQKYLQENYPDQFDGGEDTVQDDKAEANEGVSGLSGSEVSVSNEADKATLEKVTKLTKQSEDDKKAIDDLEKALEEARASQTTLTESNSSLESQLKKLEIEKQNLVSKDQYEADLVQLHQQLNDRSKLLKGHIRSAKASAVGFNVTDSESNMNAAVQELDELDKVLANFGESALGIKANKSDKSSKAEQKLNAKAPESKKDKKQDTSKTTASTPKVEKLQASTKSAKTNTQNVKDMADASKPLTSSKTKDDKSKVKKSKSKTSTTPIEQKTIEKQDMLTPLPNTGIKTSPRTENAIAARDIDPSHGVISQVKDVSKQAETKVNAQVGAKVDTSVSESTSVSGTAVSNVSRNSTKDEVNVASIDYDAAIALKIDKNNPDLKDALESYASEFQKHTQLQVEHYISDAKFSEQNKVLLRDFVKAAFDNIAQHSDASSVLLELNPSKDGNKLELMIVDNGKGFEPDKLAKNSKMEQFKKAFSILNGELMLYSSGNEGTMINASLPLKN